MDLAEAVQTAATFLDDHLEKLHGFSPTGDLDDFIVDFQDAYAGDDDTLVLVFAVRPDADPDEPSPEVLGLARQCCDALVAEYPEVNGFSIAFEFLN
ncbi:MAG: hypothetical protein JWM10_1657 [Myxococcaceae bacterium]|nr:hypothetical protein [Myxococcaceae bacterium]